MNGWIGGHGGRGPGQGAGEPKCGYEQFHGILSAPSAFAPARLLTEEHRGANLRSWPAVDTARVARIRDRMRRAPAHIQQRQNRIPAALARADIEAS
jgi:hypothetical protein